MPESADESEIESASRETWKELRKVSKGRFTRLVSTISSHIDGQGDCGALKVHRTNLVELHNECQRHHEGYVTRAKPTGDALAATTNWRANLDLVFSKWLSHVDAYLDANYQEAEEEPDEGDEQASEAEIEELEIRMRDHTRKLADDLEDSRLEEARRAEDIRRKAKREQLDLEFKLNMARAASKRRGSKSIAGTSTTREYHDRSMLTPGPPNNTRKRTYSIMNQTAQPQPTATAPQSIDAWIYEEFRPVLAGSEGQTMVTMAMLPNLKLFSGDPREWPMFIQAFKSMVHDVFNSDAQRLSMLHTMLEQKLRNGMSQILSSPTAYRQALQELRRKYGHPHLIVRTYIQGLMELSPFQGGEVLEDFSTQLHGAVTTLDSAGYGHELDSSVALEGLVRKLPGAMIARWGRHVNQLLPNIPSLRDLDAWLEDEVMGEKNVRSIEKKPSRNVNVQTATQNRGNWRTNLIPTVNAVDVSRYGGRCAVCESGPGHKLEECQKFLGMSPTQRAQVIWDLRNCFRCLGRNHHSNVCKKVELTCGVGSCKGKHHTLLHGAESVATTKQAKDDDRRQ